MVVQKTFNLKDTGIQKNEKNITPIKKEVKKSGNVLKDLIIEKIFLNGGFVNTHAHIDRAFTITPETLYLANATLKENGFLWTLSKEIQP